jgi:hypothetical protein
MTTNPRGLERPFGDGGWQYGYFNECMSGFEHQAAAHMIAVGPVQEGLSIERAIHDRYHVGARNPWNEIECSDNYARAMASYGAFVAISGFEHHGPRRHLGFTPRMPGERFRCAFVACSGWGSFEQRVRGKEFEATLTLRQGRLELDTLRLGAAPAGVKMAVELPDGSKTGVFVEGGGLLRLPQSVVLRSDASLWIRNP